MLVLQYLKDKLLLFGYEVNRHKRERLHKIIIGHQLEQIMEATVDRQLCQLLNYLICLHVKRVQ